MFDEFEDFEDFDAEDFDTEEVEVEVWEAEADKAEWRFNALAKFEQTVLYDEDWD